MKLYLLAAISAALSLTAAQANAAAPETAPSRNAAVPARARVVIAHDPAATVTFTPVPERLPALLERGLTNLLQQPTTRAAWLSLITTQDTVGVKVLTSPGPTIGTRPAVVEAVVRSLLEAGLPPRQIVIWDKHLSDLRLAGLFSLAERYGVRVAGSAEAGYDDRFAYDKELLGRLVWGDLEFGRDSPSAGRKSHLSNLISRQVTKIVCVSPLLNHNLAGASGNLYGLAIGSVDNTLRFVNSAGRLSEAVPEIMAEFLADRVVLCITDALLCQYQGEAQPLLHYSAPLNQLWFSQDPVALDVLAVEEIERQRQSARIPGAKPNLELYQNASALELGVSSLKDIDVIRLPDR